MNKQRSHRAQTFKHKQRHQQKPNETSKCIQNVIKNYNTKTTKHNSSSNNNKTLTTTKSIWTISNRVVKFFSESRAKSKRHTHTHPNCISKCWQTNEIKPNFYVLTHSYQAMLRISDEKNTKNVCNMFEKT